MSKIDLQGTSLNFNVTIITTERESEGSPLKSTSLPLDIGAITYLEIDDNLIDYGIKGTITFVNWFQIVDKLGMTPGRGRKTLYIVIDIKSGDNKEEKRDVQFVGLMEENVSSSGNIADNKQTYKFEEALTSRLKKTTVTNLQGFKQVGTIPDLIQNLLEKSSTNHDSESFRTSSASTKEVNIRDFWRNNDSLYVTINKLYNTLSLRGEGSRRDLPLLKVETLRDSGSEERRIQLKPLLTDDHISFVDAYSTDASNNETDRYKEVYQEEFLIGPEERETANTSPYNKVEDYNHIKPNIGSLRQSVWGAYKLNTFEKTEPAATDLTNWRNNFTDLNKFVLDFETDILRGKNSNIPYIKDTDQKTFEVEAETSYGGNDETIIEGVVFNKLSKSFIFLNESIVLKVKGQVYRKPGVFITIRGSLNTRGEPITDLWFVIRNKHVFNNGNYENEITAVRFYSDSAIERQVNQSQNNQSQNNQPQNNQPQNPPPTATKNPLSVVKTRGGGRKKVTVTEKPVSRSRPLRTRGGRR